MPSDFHTTNIWLAIIAIANAILLLALAGAAIAIIRLTRRASAVVDRIEQQAAPVLARANAVIIDAQHVVDEVKLGVQKVKLAGDSVRSAITSVDRAVSRAALTARSRLWPLVGVMRGVSAATSALTKRTTNRVALDRSRSRGVQTEDDKARAVFVYEGGGSHVREPNV